MCLWTYHFYLITIVYMYFYLWAFMLEINILYLISKHQLNIIFVECKAPMYSGLYWKKTH